MKKKNSIYPGYIRCEWCGRFIGFKSIDDNKATCSFMPDSAYTSEKIEWTCEQCNKEKDERI